MRANHAVTLGLCVGIVGLSTWAAGCGTDTFGTCNETNSCGAMGEGGVEGGDDGGGDSSVKGDSSMGDSSMTGDTGATDSASDAPKDAPADVVVKCEAGATSCGGVCVNEMNDPQHCGSCSKVCPGPDAGMGMAVCSGGTCSVTCGGATTQDCGGTCYSPNDPNHCGSCSTVCPGPVAGNGTPTCPGTPPGCDVQCATGSHKCGMTVGCYPDNDPPSTTNDPCVISDVRGIFVEPAPKGQDTAQCGAQGNPCQTLGWAMDQAKSHGKVVYACGNSPGGYPENLMVGPTRTGVIVYGGLDCVNTPSQWTYNASLLAKVAPTGGTALTVSGGATAHFEDFSFTAADASGNGTSSVAALVSGSANVSFVRSSFTAGNGASGGTGAGTVPNYSGTVAAAGADGSSSGSAQGGQETCVDGTTSTGGFGGTPGAGAAPGGNGGPGLWSPKGTEMPPNDGVQGVGGAGTCTGGDSGASGAATAQGGPAVTLGTLSAAGWQPSSGTNGGNGAPGQGGGGGGGKGGGVPVGGNSGGAGGCGGTGGNGGYGGGASVALASVGSTVTLTACALTSKQGGAGGTGGAGDVGQSGGSPGLPSLACAGGYGGNGAGGAGGGGGTGGISVGILWSGTQPTKDGATSISVGGFGASGMGGAGGAGGTNGGQAPAGATALAGSGGLTGVAQSVYP